MRERGGPNKSLRANTGMVKIINLINSFGVPPCTFVYDLLRDKVGYETAPESGKSLDTVDPTTTWQVAKLQGPNPATKDTHGTMGLPKGGNPQGNGAFILGSLLPLPRSYSTEGRQTITCNNTPLITPLEGSKRLAGLHKLAKEDLEAKFPKLIHYISDLNILALAYELIKSKPGNITPGVDKETLDSIDLKFLDNTSKKIKAGKYKFPAARRVQIPKPGKKEKRPLGIASPRVKVVQKAMELVLNAIYEPIFKDTSHGFRPMKSQHSALQQIDQQFKGVVWFIEGDIAKYFDTINHSKLMEILKEKITCPKTLALIKSSLEAGYIEFGGLCEKAMLGTPQGSVLSPLLSNIYLHKLDCFMEDLMEKHNKGTKRR